MADAALYQFSIYALVPNQIPQFVHQAILLRKFLVLLQCAYGAMSYQQKYNP